MAVQLTLSVDYQRFNVTRCALCREWFKPATTGTKTFCTVCKGEK